MVRKMFKKLSEIRGIWKRAGRRVQVGADADCAIVSSGLSSGAPTRPTADQDGDGRQEHAADKDEQREAMPPFCVCCELVQATDDRQRVRRKHSPPTVAPDRGLTRFKP